MDSAWFKVRQITKDIFSIDDNGNDFIYLVKGSKCCLLIDTGFGIGDLQKIVSTLTDLPIVVVNTHGHPDHVNGNNQFSEIHIASEDLNLLKDCFSPENRKWLANNFIKGQYPSDFVPSEWINAKLNTIVQINDGYEFDLGNKVIKVFSIPGHTPGGIGLLDESERVLFTGDSLLEGEIWLYLEESLPLNTYLDSLNKLKNISDKFDQILPGHCNTPLDKNFILKVISEIEDILHGKKIGEDYKTQFGKGLISRIERCGIVYDGDKLF